MKLPKLIKLRTEPTHWAGEKEADVYKLDWSDVDAHRFNKGKDFPAKYKDMLSGFELSIPNTVMKKLIRLKNFSLDIYNDKDGIFNDSLMNEDLLCPAEEAIDSYLWILSHCNKEQSMLNSTLIKYKLWWGQTGGGNLFDRCGFEYLGERLTKTIVNITKAGTTSRKACNDDEHLDLMAFIETLNKHCDFRYSAKEILDMHNTKDNVFTIDESDCIELG